MPPALVELDLQENLFSGTLPFAVLATENMTYVSFSSNCFHASISDETAARNVHQLPVLRICLSYNTLREIQLHFALPC